MNPGQILSECYKVISIDFLIIERVLIIVVVYHGGAFLNLNETHIKCVSNPYALNNAYSQTVHKIDLLIELKMRMLVKRTNLPAVGDMVIIVTVHLNSSLVVGIDTLLKNLKLPARLGKR